MALAREDELFHDGVRIVVNWDAMKVGDSIFVPCLNQTGLVKYVERIFAKRRWKARFACCVENHILGVRVWRIT